jgi:MYXO-CTERM domain-containing protein
MMRTSLVLLALLPANALAATRTVGPSGTFATISGALNASNNGDILEIEAGNYPESLLIDIDVTLVGTAGSAATTIGGPGAAVLEIDGTTVHLEGLTLLPTAGRAIEAYAGADVVGLDLVISGFDNSVLGFNPDGGAIFMTDGSFTCNSCVLSYNHADDDGGFLNGNNTDVTLDSVDLIGNTCEDRGGALRMLGGTLTITNSLLAFNRAEIAGGTMSGGAITLDGATLNLSDSTVSDNVSGTDGGAVYAVNNSAITVDTSSFSRNGTNTDNGGAIDLLNSTLNAADTTFTDNTASNLGGAIHGDTNAEMVLMGTTFSGNSANLGGAIYAMDETTVLQSSFIDNNASGNGGAIRWFFDDGDTPLLWVEDSMFTGNAADNGGAIAAWNTDGVNLGAVEVYDSQFSNNSAADSGGALWTNGHDVVTAQRNRFCANTAGVDGGGVYMETSGASLNNWTNNVWAENTAGFLGGGMVLISAGNADIINNDFLANDAVSGGGAYAGNTNYNFHNNIISETVNGDGLQADNTSGTRDYNLWFSNLAADAGGSLGAGDLGASAVFSDPTIENYTADGICFNDIYNLLPGSPAIDAGDPGLTDIDGSPSDIGAYGGPSAPPELLEDLDGDGYDGVADCDDNNPAVNPGETEVCDGADNNCDGLTDDASAPGAVDWWLDFDGDGSGDINNVISACYPPAGYVGNDGDCDDNNPMTGPYTIETCDGIDNNCDGQVDEGFTPTDWYLDRDLDGFGDDATVVALCTQPPGTIATGGDCDDGNDQVNPNATEVCDGVDNNCDAQTDEGFSPTDWFPDADGDGFGDDVSVLTLCTAPNGWIDVGGDCADNQYDINPSITEVCDTVDNNCDGQIDEGLVVTYYVDDDEDGFGDDLTAVDLCDPPGSGVTVGGDCADTDPLINPGAEEVCDAIDNDCDFEVDEDLFSDWFRDQDGDGWGTDQDILEDCTQPAGYVAVGGDCDDTNPVVNPDMLDESRDQTDQDCNGVDGDVYALEQLLANSGCGCATGGGTDSAGWMGMLAMLGLLRRRRL